MTVAVHRSLLPIHQPCAEDFGAMRGTGARRRCEACEHDVHDLSQLTEAQARALVKRPGRVCVRYRVGPSGHIRFKTPKLGAFAAVLSLAMAACTPHGDAEELETPEEAMLCRDASGYAIECGLVSEPVIPDQPVPTEPEVEPKTEPEQESASQTTLDEAEIEDDDWILGFVD